MSVAVAVPGAVRMARRLRSSVVMGFEKGCRGGGEDGCRGGGAREGRGWRLHGHLPLGLDLLPTVHLQCTWFCSERMQCTCSAHAVHMQCTCSAHAVHMQCTCSAQQCASICPVSIHTLYPMAMQHVCRVQLSGSQLYRGAAAHLHAARFDHSEQCRASTLRCRA